jgi:hypothetical protein
MAKRPRTARRAEERDAAKLVRDKQRLAALEPGGAPERPIEVASASVVEARASSLACVLCGNQVRIADHLAEEHRGARLRVVLVVCTACGAPRALYYRIAQPN